jgi:hypothetical protein
MHPGHLQGPILIAWARTARSIRSLALRKSRRNGGVARAQPAARYGSLLPVGDGGKETTRQGGPRVGDEAAQRRIRMGRVVAYLAHQAEAEGKMGRKWGSWPNYTLFFVIPISNFRYPNQI